MRRSDQPGDARKGDGDTLRPRDGPSSGSSGSLEDSEAFFARLRARVLRVVAKDAHDLHLARADNEEIAHEAFLRVLRRSGFTPTAHREQLEARVLRAAHWVVIDRKRALSRRDAMLDLGSREDLARLEGAGGPVLAVLGLPTGDDEDGFFEVVWGQEARFALWLLVQIPEPQRGVFIMRAIRGKTFVAIARRRGIDESYARRLFKLARAQLDALLRGFHT